MAAMSGLLQEVRDIGRDAASRRTTALALGKERSADLALSALLAGASLYCAAALSGAIPPAMLALAPFTLMLAWPVLQLRKGKVDADAAIRSVRGRGLALAGSALLLFLVVSAAGL